MSHIWMSHVTHMNESCHICECSLCSSWVQRWVLFSTWMNHVRCASVMSRIWMRHVTYMHGSCLTYEWVMSHTWMSHVTHMNGTRHIYEWIMSHIWLTHVRCTWIMAHGNTSCHTYEWVVSHIRKSYVTRINESSHTYKWFTLDANKSWHIWMLPLHIRWAIFSPELARLHVWHDGSRTGCENSLCRHCRHATHVNKLIWD